AGQHRLGGRATLTAEEGAGDASRGVHALLDVDREREEVEVVLRVLAGGRRRQQHRLVVEVGDGCAGGLTGQAAGLEADRAGAEAAVVDAGFGELDLGTLHGCPPLSQEAPRGTAVFERGARRPGALRGGHGLRGPLPRTGRSGARVGAAGGGCRSSPAVLRTAVAAPWGAAGVAVG